jgi:hypothetical protein
VFDSTVLSGSTSFSPEMSTAAGGVVHMIEVNVDGQRKFLPVGSQSAVILAASGIESTRLALLSFPTSLMGRNLMAHVRSDFTVRVRRSALPPVPAHVQTAALLVRGVTPPAASTFKSRPPHTRPAPTSSCFE